MNGMPTCARSIYELSMRALNLRSSNRIGNSFEPGRIPMHFHSGPTTRGPCSNWGETQARHAARCQRFDDANPTSFPRAMNRASLHARRRLIECWATSPSSHLIFCWLSATRKSDHGAGMLTGAAGSYPMFSNGVLFVRSLMRRMIKGQRRSRSEAGSARSWSSPSSGALTRYRRERCGGAENRRSRSPTRSRRRTISCATVDGSTR
jgi:hypothetical protein